MESLVKILPELIKDANPWVIGPIVFFVLLYLLKLVLDWRESLQNKRFDWLVDSLTGKLLTTEMQGAVEAEYQASVFRRMSGLDASRGVRIAIHEAMRTNPQLTYRSFRGLGAYMRASAGRLELVTTKLDLFGALFGLGSTLITLLLALSFGAYIVEKINSSAVTLTAVLLLLALELTFVAGALLIFNEVLRYVRARHVARQLAISSQDDS